MINKIQTRIVFLFCLIAIILVVTLFYNFHTERKRQAALFDYKKDNIHQLFNNILELKGKTLENIGYNEYPLWNEMVDVVDSKKIEEEWAEENIDWLIPTYGFSAAWVYAKDFSLIYSVNEFNDKSLYEFPIPVSELENIYSKNKFLHFYLSTKHGVMEIRGSTIHPSVDTDRETPVRGYFLAGRLWNKKYINEIAALTGCAAEITPLNGKGVPPQIPPLEPGAILCSDTLPGPSGKPVAILEGVYSYRLMEEMRHFSNNQLLMFLISFFLSLIIMVIALTHWITRPLKLISMSLKRDNAAYVKDLKKSKTEFGELAQLIDNFFNQQNKLKEEMEEHKHTAEKLREARAGLEQWGDKLEEKVKEYAVELKDAEENISRTDQLITISKLASLVSHDLKTPLTAIKNAVYYLKMLGLDKQNDKVENNLSLINKEVDECVKIINNVLGFAKPRELERKETNLEDIINESVYSFQIPPNIEVKKDFEKDFPVINVDPVQMRQVFDNIIKNAIEAMGGGGGLSINLFKKDDHAVMEFEDMGKGIAEENMTKIFNPLFSTALHAAGLGLSVCQIIVSAHGGSIEVQSKVGEGATFTVKVPFGK